MPDIQMRFNKDMLVLSTPLDYQLAAQGFDAQADRAYVVMCEPELIEEQYKLEKMLGTPCLVAPTEDITEARLAHACFEGNAADMARIAYESGAKFTPQHLIAAIGPTGLPLDPTSATSLKQGKSQYHDAVKLLAEYPFDALYLCGFSNSYDAQCALMGARAVYDGPLFISLVPNMKGTLACGRSLEDAVQLCDEYGADVIGVSSFAPQVMLEQYARRMSAVTDKPLLVEIGVRRRDKRQYEPTAENPYPSPDYLVDAALALQKCGVQFLRAAGSATPAYTGALAATVAGLDVAAGE